MTRLGQSLYLQFYIAYFFHLFDPYINLMQHSRSALITQADLVRLPKLGSTARKEQQCRKTSKKDRFYVRPEIKKILYAPVQPSPAQKIQKKQLILQSCLFNKSYDDVKEHKVKSKFKSYLNENRPKTLDNKQSLVSVKNESLVSKQAPFNYYKDYKKLSKLREKSVDRQNFSQSQSPYLAMLQKTQKLQLLPLTFNLIKFQGVNNILNLNNYNLGDKYIIAMSAGLKNAKLIQKCYLSSNRITNKGCNQLVNNLNHQISILDISYNKITHLDDKLMQLVTHPQSHLENLNLENNLVRNKENVTSLFQNISISRHLKVLNIRANGIAMDCAYALCELIDMETHLEELYIGRNFLTAAAGQRIFDVLVTNKNIKVFDYSLNNLGDDQNNLCAKAIANCMTKNKTLQHVDLSSNNFSQTGSKIIADGLEPNKKIYGFHFDGNHGFIDSKGFLKIEEKQLTSLHSLVQTKIDSYNVVFRRHNSTASPKLFKNVCWICEGWYEQQFKFVIPDDFKQDKKLVFLHFDFEIFEPRLININDKIVKYTTMVPPTRYRYFFTFDGKPWLDQNAKVNHLQFPESYSYVMDNQPINFTVQDLSEKPKAKPKKIVNEWNEIIINTLPRFNGLIAKKQKQIWTYGISVWAKQWKLQNEELLKKCFQKDWNCSKLMNLIKNQQDQDKVKQKLFKSYKEIKLLYRNYASWSPFGDLWAVSNNVWTQCCQQSKLISKDTPLKITDLTFITTNSISGADWKGNALVPERGLVRFQFMECLVRLAEQKFKKLGITENFADSVEFLLKDHILPLARTLHFEKWRMEEYFIEQNDILIKKYRPIFNYVYKKNSKLKVKPGEKPFMCLNELRSILQRLNLAGNSILERDIYLSFNFSMMTQVDELENERFMKMSEIEFIQAMARCANILPKSCSLSSQTKQMLHFKFEWLINELKNTLCNEEIKSQFNEEGSIFDQNDSDN